MPCCATISTPSPRPEPPGIRRQRRSFVFRPRPGAGGETAAGPGTICMSVARVFLDTNVLVYLFNEDSPSHQQLAREVFAAHSRTGLIILSPQVLQEFYVTVTRKLSRPLT